MATIKSGILGGLSGRVGNVVGSSWKGIDYLRSLASHVANPNTISQQTARKKMRMVAKFLSTCNPLIRVGFKGYAEKMTPFNAATTYNLEKAISGVFPDLVLDYSALVIALGNLAGGEGVSCESAVPGQVSFSWTDNSASGNCNPGDTALLLIYNPAKETAVFRMVGISRSDAGAVLNVPGSFSGSEVHCYLAFADLTRMTGSMLKDVVSNSEYAGTVIVA